MDATITVSDLVRLSEELGLPYVINENSITVIGLVQLIIFKKLEETNQWQLTEIY